MNRKEQWSIGVLTNDTLTSTTATITTLTATSATIAGGSAAYLLDSGNVTATADGAVQSLTIPAGTTVLQVYVQIVTAAGEVATATVGDGSDANGWDASVDLNATAGTRTAAIIGTDAYAVGKLYSTADTIDLTVTFTGGTGTAVYKVQALCV